MYSKIVVLLCASGIAAAGNLLHGAPYSRAPAVSQASFASNTVPVAAYNSPALSTYAASPVVSKTFTSPVSYQSYSTYSSPAVSAYSAPIVAKAVAYSAPAVSYSLNSGPLSYARPSPIAVKVAPAYETQAISSYRSAPYLVKSVSPTLSYPNVAAHSPFSTYAVSSPQMFSGSPALKTVNYSAEPAISHVSYSGLGTSYNW